MGKQSRAKKPEKNLGKGKVTPVQIAFIVDRYLADNNYTGALSAFRSEASDLFSKTKGKEAPKGLLGLGEILDEYISLKEQRLAVDQEKRRVEMALGGIQDVMRSYYSVGGMPFPSSPPLLPPQFVATPTGPSFPASNPNNGSPPGYTIQGTPIVNGGQSPMIKVGEVNNSMSLVPIYPLVRKRKASNSAPSIPSAPKKPHTQSASSMIRGANKLLVVPSPSTNYQTNKSSTQGSSVAKSLFKMPFESQADFSSPRTPPRALPSQPEESVSYVYSSPRQSNNASTCQEIASSNCSIMSTETIIVSPLKQTGYFAVQRSYCVKSSPLKSNTIISKRDHVKGRLDFNESNVPSSSVQPLAGGSSTSSTDDETQGDFDLDLPQLDLFNGDFSFSDLLVDLDLDCEGISCQVDSTLSDMKIGSELQLDNGSFGTNQTVSHSHQLAISEVVSNKNLEPQGS